MAVRVNEYIDDFVLAAAAIGEAHTVLSGADSEAGDKQYAQQVLAGGFKQLRVAARRYMQSDELRKPSGAYPILTNGAVKAAIEKCASALEAASTMLKGGAEQRIAPTLRKWLTDPGVAVLLAAQAEGAEKQAKYRASKAA